MNENTLRVFIPLLCLPLLSLAADGPWDRVPPYKPGIAKGIKWSPDDMQAIASLQGRVALAFSIGMDGKPKNIVVLTSDDQRLETPAINYLRRMRYPVPATWGTAGEQWKRYDALVAFAQNKQVPAPAWLGSIEGYVVRTDVTGD